MDNREPNPDWAEFAPSGGTTLVKPRSDFSLDASTLGGIDPDYIVRGSNGNRAENLSSVDLDTIRNSGFYYCVSAINRPIGQNGYLRVTGFSTTYAIQEYMPYGQEGAIYVRRQQASVWGPWVFIGQEKGTFTPSLKFGGASVGMTYTRQLGYYTRTADVCNVWVYIILSAKGTSVGTAAVHDLPFLAFVTSGMFYSGVIDYNVRVIYTGGVLNCYIPSNANAVSFAMSTSDASSVSRTNAHFANDSAIMFHISYPIAA